MSLQDFYSELDKGLGKPVYLLVAEDAYLLKEAAFMAKKTIAPEEIDFLYHTFDMESSERTSNAEQIIDILRTIPLMGGRKTIVVENSQKLPDPQIEKFSQYIASPSPDSVLLLLNTGTLKKGHQEMLKKARLIRLDIRERDLPFWIQQKAASKGIQLTDRAIEHMIGTVGPDAGLLSSEVEKFAACGKSTLDESDIIEITKGPGDYDAFDLVDALSKKDAPKAFKIYRVLSETQEGFALLGALNWHYGRIKNRLKDSARVFEMLSEADRLLKSSGGAYPFEYLLIKLLRM